MRNVYLWRAAICHWHFTNFRTDITSHNESCLPWRSSDSDFIPWRTKAVTSACPCRSIPKLQKADALPNQQTHFKLFFRNRSMRVCSWKCVSDMQQQLNSSKTFVCRHSQWLQELPNKTMKKFSFFNSPMGGHLLPEAFRFVVGVIFMKCRNLNSTVRIYLFGLVFDSLWICNLKMYTIKRVFVDAERAWMGCIITGSRSLTSTKLV